MDSVDNPHQGEQSQSETTRLLSQRNDPQETDYFIEPVAASVRAKGIKFCTIADWCPHRLASRTQETSFALIVLLYLHRSILNSTLFPQDVWEQWYDAERDSALASNLNSQIVRLWGDYVKGDRTEEEIEEVLWAGFPLSFQHKGSLRGQTTRFRVCEAEAHSVVPFQSSTS